MQSFFSIAIWASDLHQRTQYNTTSYSQRYSWKISICSGRSGLQGKINDTTQHNTTQHNTTQHNTTQHNTTQHNTTQHTTTTWQQGDTSRQHYKTPDNSKKQYGSGRTHHNSRTGQWNTIAQHRTQHHTEHSITSQQRTIHDATARTIQQNGTQLSRTQHNKQDTRNQHRTHRSQQQQDST